MLLLYKNSRQYSISNVVSEESAIPHRFKLSEPQGDPRLELGEVGADLSEMLYEVFSHVQMTMGEEQRRPKEYYERKVQGKPYNPGRLVWLLEFLTALARSLRSVKSIE